MTSERVSRSDDLARAKRAASKCKNCPLWRNATQTVFGEGKASSAMMIVGEQPGDQEDAPASRLSDLPESFLTAH